MSRRCRAAGLPAIALVGAIEPDAASLLDQGLTAFFSLCDRPMTTTDAIKQAARLLESLAENVVRMHRASRS